MKELHKVMKELSKAIENKGDEHSLDSNAIDSMECVSGTKRNSKEDIKILVSTLRNLKDPQLRLIKNGNLSTLKNSMKTDEIDPGEELINPIKSEISGSKDCNCLSKFECCSEEETYNLNLPDKNESPIKIGNFYDTDGKLNLENFKVYPCKLKYHMSDRKNCPYYHNNRDRRRLPAKYKAEQCEYHFDLDCDLKCPYGDKCEKCHNRCELLYHLDVYKKRFCSNFPYKKEICSRGKLCAFAHSREEIMAVLLDPKEETNPTVETFIYKFKTMWCPYGHQHDWNSCIYAHNFQDCRRWPALGYGSEPCPYWNKSKLSDYNSRCPNGVRCPFSHGSKEQLYHPDYYKTMPCSDYKDFKKCPRGEMCAFYHNLSEKRTILAREVDYNTLLFEANLAHLQTWILYPPLFNLDDFEAFGNSCKSQVNSKDNKKNDKLDSFSSSISSDKENLIAQGFYPFMGSMMGDVYFNSQRLESLKRNVLQDANIVHTLNSNAVIETERSNTMHSESFFKAYDLYSYNKNFPTSSLSFSPTLSEQNAPDIEPLSLVSPGHSNIKSFATYSENKNIGEYSEQVSCSDFFNFGFFNMRENNVWSPALSDCSNGSIDKGEGHEIQLLGSQLEWLKSNDKTNPPEISCNLGDIPFDFLKSKNNHNEEKLDLKILEHITKRSNDHIYKPVDSFENISKDLCQDQKNSYNAETSAADCNFNSDDDFGFKSYASSYYDEHSYPFKPEMRSAIISTKSYYDSFELISVVIEQANLKKIVICLDIELEWDILAEAYVRQTINDFLDDFVLIFHYQANALQLFWNNPKSLMIISSEGSYSLKHNHYQNLDLLYQIYLHSNLESLKSKIKTNIDNGFNTMEFSSHKSFQQCQQTLHILVKNESETFLRTLFPSVNLIQLSNWSGILSSVLLLQKETQRMYQAINLSKSKIHAFIWCLLLGKRCDFTEEMWTCISTFLPSCLGTDTIYCKSPRIVYFSQNSSCFHPTTTSPRNDTSDEALLKDNNNVVSNLKIASRTLSNDYCKPCDKNLLIDSNSRFFNAFGYAIPEKKAMNTISLDKLLINDLINAQPNPPTVMQENANSNCIYIYL